MTIRRHRFHEVYCRRQVGLIKKDNTFQRLIFENTLKRSYREVKWHGIGYDEDTREDRNERRQSIFHNEVQQDIPDVTSYYVDPPYALPTLGNTDITYLQNITTPNPPLVTYVIPSVPVPFPTFGTPPPPPMTAIIGNEPPVITIDNVINDFTGENPTFVIPISEELLEHFNLVLDQLIQHRNTTVVDTNVLIVSDVHLDLVTFLLPMYITKAIEITIRYVNENYYLIISFNPLMRNYLFINNGDNSLNKRSGSGNIIQQINKVIVSFMQEFILFMKRTIYADNYLQIIGNHDFYFPFGNELLYKLEVNRTFNIQHLMTDPSLDANYTIPEEKNIRLGDSDVHLRLYHLRSIKAWKACSFFNFLSFSESYRGNQDFDRWLIEEVAKFNYIKRWGDYEVSNYQTFHGGTLVNPHQCNSSMNNHPSSSLMNNHQCNPTVNNHQSSSLMNNHSSSPMNFHQSISGGLTVSKFILGHEQLYSIVGLLVKAIGDQPLTKDEFRTIHSPSTPNAMTINTKVRLMTSHLFPDFPRLKYQKIVLLCATNVTERNLKRIIDGKTTLLHDKWICKETPATQLNIYGISRPKLQTLIQQIRNYLQGTTSVHDVVVNDDIQLLFNIYYYSFGETYYRDGANFMLDMADIMMDISRLVTQLVYYDLNRLLVDRNIGGNDIFCIDGSNNSMVSTMSQQKFPNFRDVLGIRLTEDIKSIHITKYSREILMQYGILNPSLTTMEQLSEYLKTHVVNNVELQNLLFTNHLTSTFNILSYKSYFSNHVMCLPENINTITTRITPVINDASAGNFIDAHTYYRPIINSYNHHVSTHEPMSEVDVVTFADFLCATNTNLVDSTQSIVYGDGLFLINPATLPIITFNLGDSGYAFHSSLLYHMLPYKMILAKMNYQQGLIFDEFLDDRFDGTNLYDVVLDSFNVYSNLATPEFTTHLESAKVVEVFHGTELTIDDRRSYLIPQIGYIKVDYNDKPRTIFKLLMLHPMALMFQYVIQPHMNILQSTEIDWKRKIKLLNVLHGTCTYTEFQLLNYPEIKDSIVDCLGMDMFYEINPHSYTPFTMQSVVPMAGGLSMKNNNGRTLMNNSGRILMNNNNESSSMMNNNGRTLMRFGGVNPVPAITSFGVAAQPLTLRSPEFKNFIALRHVYNFSIDDELTSRMYTLLSKVYIHKHRFTVVNPTSLLSEDETNRLYNLLDRFLHATTRVQSSETFVEIPFMLHALLPTQWKEIYRRNLRMLSIVEIMELDDLMNRVSTNGVSVLPNRIIDDWILPAQVAGGNIMKNHSILKIIVVTLAMILLIVLVVIIFTNERPMVKNNNGEH